MEKFETKFDFINDSLISILIKLLQNLSFSVNEFLKLVLNSKYQQKAGSLPDMN
jgi:hypothetical protein